MSTTPFTTAVKPEETKPSAPVSKVEAPAAQPKVTI